MFLTNSYIYEIVRTKENDHNWSFTNKMRSFSIIKITNKFLYNSLHYPFAYKLLSGKM